MKLNQGFIPLYDTLCVYVCCFVVLLGFECFLRSLRKLVLVFSRSCQSCLVDFSGNIHWQEWDSWYSNTNQSFKVQSGTVIHS